MITPKELAEKARSVPRIISEAIEDNGVKGLAKNMSPDAARRWLMKRFEDRS